MFCRIFPFSNKIKSLKSPDNSTKQPTLTALPSAIDSKFSLYTEQLFVCWSMLLCNANIMFLSPMVDSFTMMSPTSLIASPSGSAKSHVSILSTQRFRIFSPSGCNSREKYRKPLLLTLENLSTAKCSIPTTLSAKLR